MYWLRAVCTYVFIDSVVHNFLTTFSEFFSETVELDFGQIGVHFDTSSDYTYVEHDGGGRSQGKDE